MVGANLNNIKLDIVPYNFWYSTDNGLLQRVIGDISAGAWQVAQHDFYWPITSSFKYSVPLDIAMEINWNKIKELLPQDLTPYKDMSVREILSSLGIIEEVEVPISIVNNVVVQTGTQKQIKPEYKWQPPHFSDNMEVIDITETAAFRSEND